MFTLNPTSYPDNAFKTPARSTKLSKSRAFYDENDASFYPQTIKRSNKTKVATQRTLLTSKTPRFNWSTRRPNDHKGVIGLNPLSEITNKTPHPKKKNEEITLSKCINLLDVAQEAEMPEVSSCRRLSSTRKTVRLPSSDQKNLKTPISGNPWDVSDGSIDVVPPVIEQVPLEDEDDIEYCPPTAIIPDHGLNVEFPDYTEARHLFSNTFADEIHEPLYKVDLSLEDYELAPVPLIEESDLLMREIFPEKDKPFELPKNFSDLSVQTKVNARTVVRHSRIPSLSKQYVAKPLAKKDSSPSIQAVSASTIPLRSTQKPRSLKTHTQAVRINSQINEATSRNERFHSSKRSLPDDIVAELLNDSFETEDIFFEV